MSFRKNIKAISPVIATIIIVAVTIVLSITVALWISGIATRFTRYENLEYRAVITIPTSNGWNITLRVKNTGSAPASITHILINEIPYDQIVDGNNTDMVTLYKNGEEIDDLSSSPIVVNPGSEVVIIISIKSGDYHIEGQTSGDPLGTFSSGTVVNIVLKTATGEYPKNVGLH